jgi:hypothetical protein
MTPYVYIAIGAMHAFDVMVSIITLPPLLLSNGYLLRRYLARPAHSKCAWWACALEALCWAATVTFLIVVSNFTLLTTFERLGLTVTFFAIATIVCVPVVLLRATALQQRLTRVPTQVARLALAAIVAATAVTVAVHLLKAPAFI